MSNVLTKEVLLSKSKASSLEEVKNLNLWGLKLVDISIVEKLPNVETIALSVNEIKTLKPFSHCKNLRELFLRKNQIPSISEINYLKDLPNLQTLWLTDNPITQEKGYRNIVIATLPKLTKLDEVDITPEERAEATKVYKQMKAASEKKPPSSSSGSKSSSGSSSSSKPSSKGSSSSKESQDNILNAIGLLIKELDNDALDVLADQVKQLRASRK
ncbi:Protein C21orf2 [Tritrichomonas foetus]|uniref:Protein C21orf2 n=1 Tax=Tritrichomonas foetus TaxID=1144522 RepID=A0A1J4JAB6_9EUKA|nr:Protein C21orf2 [Tritrichomonas foetus]|eukprot:OHS94204.1 Protein C21orf2 [Tritrichomonas foetus]